VLIVVDAWRFDFVDPAAPPSAATGHMPRLAARLRSAGDAAGLFPFVADPPTVTMQRLKALLTGSLPTFFDAAADLASPVLQEDNLLSQLKQHARRGERLFFGDDTWMSLAPAGAFTRAVPYESFNVRDLHMVDTGVAAHLLPAVGATNWTVIVAHFLGVDHVGHTFNSPAAPAMAAKLAELDDVLDRVLAAAPDDSLVAVLGDHGMTDGGAHGGVSDDETRAALLLYAPQGGLLAPIPPPPATHRPAVAQLDLVPTLALLLGLPIPYGSLGRVIPDVLHVHPAHAPPSRDAAAACESVHAAAAAAVNARQLARYVHTYRAAGLGAAGLDDDAEGGRAGAALDAALAAWTALVDLAVIEHGLTIPRTAGACSCDTPTRHVLRGNSSSAPSSPLPRRCAEVALADAVCSSQAPHSPASAATLAREAAAVRGALHAAMGDVAAMFRRMWVQFDERAMAWGLALVAAGVVVLVITALDGIDRGLTAPDALPPRPRWRLCCGSTVAGLACQLVAQPAPTLRALSLFASLVAGTAGATVMSPATLPPSASALEWCAPLAVRDLLVPVRLPFLLPPGVGGPLGALAAWAGAVATSAWRQRQRGGCRSSNSVVAAAAAPLSLPALLGVVVLVRRVDTVFASSFIVNEAPVAAFFASVALVLLGMSAARAHLSPTGRGGGGGGGSGWGIATTLAAGLVAIRITTPGVGAAWPFPGGADAPWSLHAPHMLTAVSVAVFVAAPAALAWLPTSTATARAVAALHGGLNAAVAAYWFAMAGSGAAADGTAVALRLWLPRAVFGVSLAAAVGAVTAPLRLVARSDTPPQLAVALHPVLACARLAAPSLHLLLGPASQYALPAAGVAVWSIAVLQRYAARSLGSAAPSPQPCWSTATALLRSDAWLPALAAAWVADHFYFATGHASRFSALAVTAGYVGWDDFAPARAVGAVAVNTLGVHAGVAAAVAGLAPPSCAAATGGVGIAALIAVPHVLVAAASAAMSCVSRRHLMVWALFAPRFVYATAVGAVSAACAAAAASCCCPRRRHDDARRPHPD